MEVRAKRIEKLHERVSVLVNKLVVKVLNLKGYECDDTTSDMVRINKLLKLKGQKVIVEHNNETVRRDGRWYTYNADIYVKIVDTITGREV